MSRQRPDLSIVVVVYDMAREAPRTLHSLSADYQRSVEPERYEVLVMDNGSTVPLGKETVQRFGPNFRYEYIDHALPSPAAAANRGAALAVGKWLGLMIDGARMVTPGLLAAGLSVLKRQNDTVVETMSFHLGSGVKGRSPASAHDGPAEDALLRDIDWPSDGYRLFEVASLAGASKRGWFKPIAESNCLLMPLAAFARLGGYDERFDQPGGGLLNLDLYRRILDDPELTNVRLLGEATFHQSHGGAATGLDPSSLEGALLSWKQRYREIRGRDYRYPTESPTLHGSVGPTAARWLCTSASLAWPDQNAAQDTR